jgi:hypothetical protein
MTQADAEKVLDWMRDTAPEIGLAISNKTVMEQRIKTVKATIMMDQIGMSNAAAETVALASQTYADALEAYRQAVEQAETLRFLFSAAQAKFEFWRSMEASRRAEGKAVS